MLGAPEDDPLLVDDPVENDRAASSSPSESEPDEAKDYVIHSAYRAGSAQRSGEATEGRTPTSEQSRRRLAHIEEHVVPTTARRDSEPIASLNEALDEGWKLEGLRAESGRSESHTVVVTLYRRRPPSLFDFG